jgi:hypothetical protein
MRLIWCAALLAGSYVTSAAAAGPAAASLNGTAALPAMGGESVGCANEGVLLLAPPQAGAPAHGGPASYRAACDAQGHFTIAALPAGAWIVRAHITWTAPAKHGFLVHGGWVQRAVILHPGANVVTLSAPDQLRN